MLTFDWQQVRNSLTATTDDYLDARRQYNEHPELYQRKEADSQPDTQIGPTSAPATQEGPSTQPFEEVRSSIIRDILDRRAAQKIKDMTDAANGALKAAWDHFQDQADAKGFYNVPSAQWPKYESIAAGIEKQFGVRPKVEAYGRDWLTAKSIASDLTDGIRLWHP